jgi:hypothetical protein
MLYINTDLVNTVQTKDLLSNIEKGDYVMVNLENNDLKSVTINDNIKIIAPARIEKIEED